MQHRGLTRLLAGIAAVTAALAAAGPAAAAQTPSPSPSRPTSESSSAPTSTPTPKPSASAAAPAAPAAPASPAEKPTASDTASAAAQRTGKPVEITALTSETKQIVANPNGTFTSTTYSRPVRVKKNGAWTAIDGTLARNADGSYSPKASLAAVSFSPGGTGPAVTVTSPDGKTSVALSWPTALPTPQVSGNAALYPAVLPGVDLRLAATGDSYSEVLIVHDAAAAANPALASLKLHVHGNGISLKEGSDHGLSGVDQSGTEILHAPQPIMWDSHADQHTGPTPTADEPGSGVVTPLSTKVTAAAPRPNATDASSAKSSAGTEADLTLTPPATALTGPGVKYPIFMDPGFDYYQQYWDEVDNQGEAWWNNSSLNAKVGLCDYSGCNYPWRTMRAYYQMATPELSQGNGTHATVYDAHFHITQVWNGANGCTATPVDLFSAGIIGSGTSWPGPIGSMLDRQYSGAGNGCAAADVSLNAQSFVQTAANNWWPNTTFALRADTETDDRQWKQFNNQAQLSVTYNYPPNNPANLQLTNQIICNGTVYTPDAYPTFKASASDNNPAPLNLNLWFEMYRGGDDSASSRLSWNTSGINVPSGGYGTWQENLGGLGVANWQFRVSDSNTPGSGLPAAYSGWAGWSRFTSMSENLSGYIPTVSSYDFPNDAYGNAQWGAPQGYGQFQVGTGGSPNVVGYQYSFDNNAFNAPPTCGSAPQGSAVAATGGGGAMVPVPPNTALAFGHHTLYVRGYDMVGNPTGVASYQFMVAPNYGASATAHLPISGAISNMFLGKCLDDPNNGGASGDISQVWDCNAGQAQIWTLNPSTSTPGAFTVNRGGLCLDIIGGPSATAAGTKVQQYTCNGWANQQWQIQQDGNGYWRFYNPNSNRCLDDPNWSQNNGTQLEIWDCNSTTAQTWSFDLSPNRYEGQDALSGVTVTNPASGWPTPRTQGNVGGAVFSGGNQLWWYGNGPGSTMKIPFTIATEADYALGIRMLQATDYAQVSFTLDNDTKPLTPANMPGGVFDAYANACCSMQFVPLGGKHLTSGAHTLTLTVTGKNSASSNYGIGVDFLQAAPYANATADSFAHSLNNHGISDDGSPAAANLDFASPPNTTDNGGTGVGDSLSSQALAAAKLAPTTPFTLNGLNFTMPQANNGYDNTIAMGQTITLDPAQQIRANAVGLLVLATNGGTPATNATVNYRGGEAPDVPAVPAVADWCSGPTGSAAYTLAYRNTPSGKDSNCAARLYLVVLPVHPMNNLQSVTLPYYGTGLTPGSHNPALHVLAIGVRPAAGANLTSSADASGNNHPVNLNGRYGFDNANKGGAAAFDYGYGATSGPVLDTSKSFTVSGWAYLSDTNNWRNVVAQAGTSASGFYLEYEKTFNAWAFEMNSQDNASPSSTFVAHAAGPPALNTWTHLVGVYDASTGTMSLYVNGVLAATANNPTAWNATGPLLIGESQWNGTPGAHFVGEIADVQAYQRALSASDVSTLYNGPVTNSLSTPAGWWQLEDFGRNWTGAWAAQPDSAAPAATPALGGMTIRQVVHPSNLGYGTVNTLVNGTGGTVTSPVQTRIRLTNTFGSGAVTVNASTVAAQTSANGAATGQPNTLTFGGQASVTINPGAEAVSDPVTLPDTTTGSGNLVISLALASGTGTPPVANQLTGPAYPVYLATGNQTGDQTGAGSTWSTNANLTGRYWLSGLDVTDVNDPFVAPTAGSQPGTIAVLGDQVSGAGNPATWVDALGTDTKVFSPAAGNNPGAFVNLSNTGATVANADTQFSSAPNATVLDEPNLKAVIVTLGLNDLKNGASAATIEGNLNTLVSSLSPYGITNHYNPDGTRKVDVYLATVPDAPGLTAAQETERNSLNTCLNGGACGTQIQFGAGNAGGVSGVLDLAGAVAGAGANPTQAQINSAVLAKIEANNAMITNW